MRLIAFGLVDGGGAVLLDEETGWPYPVAPGEFVHAADAQEFLRWAGEAINYAPVHARALARRWQAVRTWSFCDACPDGVFGRVTPGEALCEVCRDEAAHERRRLNAERERIAVAPAGSKWT